MQSLQEHGVLRLLDACVNLVVDDARRHAAPARKRNHPVRGKRLHRQDRVFVFHRRTPKSIEQSFEHVRVRACRIAPLRLDQLICQFSAPAFEVLRSEPHLGHPAIHAGSHLLRVNRSH